MKRKSISLILAAMLAATVLSGCGVSSLPAVQNLNYADGILSYDEVAGATGYELVFKRGGETVYEDTVDITEIDVESLGLEGTHDVTVRALAPNAVGTAKSIRLDLLTTFDEVTFEAEDWLHNFGTGKQNSNFRNNPLAHKGAYVGGIDDAGQGIYINYLCPFDGTFELTAYYLTARDFAVHEVWVNGKYQADFEYDVNTGWGGDRFNPAEKTVEITLKRGWNTISIMKNGVYEDEYGYFAELDYLVLKGNGQKYNVDDLASFGTHPPFYRLEAEMGSPRKKNVISYTTECKNPCIKQDGSFVYSNGFLMGGIESTYDGVEWHFNSPYKARYRVVLAYASGYFTAEEDEHGKGSSPAAPTLIVTQTEVELFASTDFRKMEQVAFDPLPYTGWNNVTIATQTVEITLEQGKNFIYCIKMNNSGYFQLDYIDLVLVEYLED